MAGIETITFESTPGDKCKKCRKCKYRASINGQHVICYYIVHTGHRRGCPGGNDCTRYEKGKPKRVD